MIPAFFERMKLHFKLLRRSAQDQAALDKVTARLTGSYPKQYQLGLLGPDGKELKCVGYKRALLGEVLAGNHSAYFGPFLKEVTVMEGILFAPVTGDPISKIGLAVVHTLHVGETLNFNYTVNL